VSQLRSVIALLMIGLLAFAVGCGGGDGEKDSKGNIKARMNKAKKLPPARRAREYVKIAKDQKEIGDRSGAEETLKLAIQACEEIDVESKTDQAINAYIDLAVELHKVGEKSKADEALRDARRATEKFKDDDIEDRIQALARIAEAYAVHLKDKTKAERRLGDAQRLLEEAKDLSTNNRIQSMAEIAKAAYGMKLDSADQLIDDAKNLALGQERPADRVRSFLVLGKTMAELKRKKEARTLYSTAEDEAKKIENPVSQADALARVAKGLGELGDTARADKMLKSAYDLTRDVSDGTQKPVQDMIGDIRDELKL